MVNKVPRLRRAIRVTGVIFIGVTVVIPLFTFYMVNNYTGRPAYSSEYVQRHASNYKRLSEEFGAQPISLTTEDNIQLAGLLIERPQAQRVLLVCHGYRMCKERMLKYVEIFPQDTIFMFDYRAHGQSTGVRTTLGYAERLDVKAALEFLQHDARTCTLPIIGIGVSMGAVSLLGAVAQKPCVRALILDSPFARLDEQAHKAFLYQYRVAAVPFATLAEQIYQYLLQCSLAQVNALSWAQTVHIPTMVIHTQQDRVVPIADARLLFDCLAAQEKQFWHVVRSEHARIVEDVPEYAERVEHFLQIADIYM